MMATEVKYKKTGIDGLPEIPKHWQIIRIKNLLFEIDQRSATGQEDLLSVSQYSGVTRRKDRFEDGEEITNAKSLKGYKIVERGDLIVNIMLAWNGSLGTSPYKGITSPAYCVYRIKDNHNPEFFGYLFSTDFFKTEFRKSSTGIIESRLRLYTDRFFRIFCYVPPKAEQDEIVNHIQQESAKITRFIQTKERFIELLKEQRQSIITHAVTKGLNYDSDDYRDFYDSNKYHGNHVNLKNPVQDKVKMKKTGIDWMPEIPKHWEIRRLKYLADVRFSTVDKHSFKGEHEVRLCNYNDVYKNEYITNDINFMKATASNSEVKRFTVESGDVIITKDSETPKEIAIPALVTENLENVVCGYHLAQIKPKRNLLLSEFLFRLFQSRKINSHFEVAAQGVTRYGLSYDDINSAFFLFPQNLHEQEEICKYINSETRSIDIAISKAEREIELIKEYREAMIAEAVTGKSKL